MRAAKLVATEVLTTDNASGNTMEALVANLCISSAGQNQNSLLRLFCTSVRKYFDASGTCCRLFSRREGWVASYSEGKLPWGAFEGALPPFHEEMISEMVRTRGTVVRLDSKTGESRSMQRCIGSAWMAIPFLTNDEMLGAALLVRPAGSENFDEELIRKASAIGTVMAGLLEHARILGQVEVSRKQWVQVMDTIPDCIVVHDKQRKIVRANSALAKRIDTHPINLVGRDIRDVIKMNDDESNGFLPVLPARV